MTNLNNSTEIWKDVRGFEGRYKISNHGNLLSINGKWKQPKIITPNKVDSGGYLNVSLRFQANGIKRYCVRMHQLVAEHFLIKPDTTERIEIDHKDSNRTNNHFENLRYLTASEHRAETVRKGEHNLKGENHPNSKLKSYQVLSAREMHENGTSIKELSGIYDISPRQMRDVVSGKNWGWL